MARDITKPGRARGAGGGGKGGDSGSNRAPREAENTLRSKAFATFVDILGEGPIKGLVDGGKSMFFNSTPLIAADGSSNFKGVTYTVMPGMPDQSPLAGFDASSAETDVNIQVKASGGPITRTIAVVPLSAIIVTMRVAALYQQDTGTGDTNPYSVDFKIELKVDGGAWVEAISDTISGKTTSPYDRAYRIAVPTSATSSYSLRVTRRSGDDSTSSTQSSLYWASYTQVLDWPMVYPDTAYVHLAVDSEQFGNQIASRSYEVDGLLIKVPSNYDPASRAYSGIWDGTFKVAWTDNPAWVFYDLLTNTRYGLGNFIPASRVDKWSLYTIAQYCDGMVPDGLGGFEPRFTFNGVINHLDDAYTQLQMIASCFRGMAYYGAGLITASQDSPVSIPVKVVSNATVIGGAFGYEGTSLKARHTQARVSYIDRDDSYHATIEVVEEPEGMAKWGLRPIDVQAPGCTRRSQARRIGLWILDSEKNERETVTYRTGLEHADLRPGDVIEVADRWYAGVRLGGRVVTASANSLTIDAPITVIAGRNHVLRFMLPDNSVVERTLTNNAGSTSTLTFSTALSVLPPPDTAWLVSVTDAAPGEAAAAARPFRVISVHEIEKAQYEVVALFYDATKYDRIELGINRPPGNFTSVTVPGSLPPPSNITVDEFVGGVGTTALLRALVSWTPPSDARITGYEVEALSGSTTIRQASTQQSSQEFPDVTPGTYVFRVRSVGLNQSVSAWQTSAAIVLDGTVDAPAGPGNLAATGGVRSIQLTWSLAANRHSNRVEVRAGSSSAFGAAGDVGASATNSFVHQGLPPLVTRYYWVRAVDNFGTASGWIGPASATTSQLLAADIQDGILNTAKFASSIEPIGLTNGVPATKSTSTIFNQSDGKLYRWNGTAYTASISAVDVNGMLSDEQLASLDAAKLSGTMDVARIAAGALDDTKLQGGTSANQIWNSTGANGLTGWSTGATDAGSTKGAVLGAAAGNWQLTGFGSAYMMKASQAAGQTFDQYWQSANRIPVVGGAKYEFQARFIPRNTSAHLRIAFYTSTGAYVSDTGGAPVPASAVTDGRTLDRYTRTWMIVTAPTGAAWALPFFRVGSGAAETNPTLIWTQALFAEARPNQTSPSVWSPGAFSDADPAFFGAGSITASLIAADTITAAQIASNAITANELSANAVVAGKIAAGAVTASSVVIQPNNLNQDPLFLDVAYWNNAFEPSGGSSTGWYRDAQNVATANGMAAQLSLWSGAGFTGTAVARFQTAAIAYGIRPASKYTLRFRAQNSTANQTLYVAVDWFDASGTYLSSAVTTVAAGTTIRPFVTAQISPPATAYGYRLSAQNQGGTAFLNSMSVGAIEFLMVADADLIVDGAIVASKIGVGAVEAGKLAAGSVVTSNLAVGSSNLIWNSTFSNGDTTGWGGWAQTGDGTVRANLRADWTLRGFGTGYMNPATGVLAAGAAFTGNWTPSGGNLPVVPGQKYQAAALVQAHRCTARVDILWFNASNGFLSDSNSATVSNYVPGVGTEEANYARLTALGTAPTGSAFAVMRVTGWGTGAADPYLFWTKAMFGQAPANATEVGLWEPGGVTQISGGQLVTRSISADRIATNAITANELAANSVVAGKIAASAISSGQIAAGEIKAVNLAADTLITSAAQMGTAVIGSAQIADLTVNRLKIANGAITGAVSASQYNNVSFGPPAHPWEGWFGLGFNAYGLVGIDISIDYRDNGIIVLFSDSDVYAINQTVEFTYSDSGGGTGGGDGSSGGGTGGGGSE